MDSFANIAEPTVDPIFVLNDRYLADPSPLKVNLGIGAYRTDEGKPWILPSVQKAKAKMIEDESVNHEYLPLPGLVSMLEATARLVFGANSAPIVERRLALQQTISGSGANHLAALLLSQSYEPWQERGEKVIYVPDPTWNGHYGIFGHLGITVKAYPWYDPSTRSLAFPALLAYIAALPPASVILLHACAHNPTGVDPTPEQWRLIADALLAGGHYAFFDSAYLGFVSGDAEVDAFSIRHFSERGVPMLVCQSWSKSAGLYGERVGCLMVVAKDQEEARKIAGHAAWAQRSEISVPPAFGANIISTILTNEDILQQWRRDVASMASRISGLRRELRRLLEEKYCTPGQWVCITEGNGMFSYLGLSPEQCRQLVDNCHVYLTEKSRISMAGLNSGNIDYVASQIDLVVRRSTATAQPVAPASTPLRSRAPSASMASQNPTPIRCTPVEAKVPLRERRCSVVA